MVAGWSVTVVGDGSIIVPVLSIAICKKLVTNKISCSWVFLMVPHPHRLSSLVIPGYSPTWVAPN